MPHPDTRFTPEDLALWYLRLNGFFTIPSFVVHPERQGGALTEVDVAGVRLPHRREFPTGDGGDDPEITAIHGSEPLVVLVEVKGSKCNLNGPWLGTDPHAVKRLVADLGLLPESLTSEAAAALRSSAAYSDSSISIRLVCIGRELNSELHRRYPRLPQRTWNNVAGFIYSRFSEYRRRKSDNRRWDEAGRTLWSHFYAAKSMEVFASHVGLAFCVDAA